MDKEHDVFCVSLQKRSRYAHAYIPRGTDELSQVIVTSEHLPELLPSLDMLRQINYL